MARISVEKLYVKNINYTYLVGKQQYLTIHWCMSHSLCNYNNVNEGLHSEKVCIVYGCLGTKTDNGEIRVTLLPAFMVYESTITN